MADPGGKAGVRRRIAGADTLEIGAAMLQEGCDPLPVRRQGNCYLYGRFDRNRRFRAAGVGVPSGRSCWAGSRSSITAVLRQGTWADETDYIIKSWWYVSGAVKPYTAEDATWYQPLIFYALGAWQWIFGHGVVSARFFSLVMTGVNIGLLASLLRRLGCTRLADRICNRRLRADRRQYLLFQQRYAVCRLHLPAADRSASAAAMNRSASLDGRDGFWRRPHHGLSAPDQLVASSRCVLGLSG